MIYQETLDWMYRQLPMYQRQGKTAFKKDLTNILAFTEELGNPQKLFKSIHVGGTNGKGSTSHMLASILQEAGYKVGLYTSPHLKNFTERVRVNGIEVSRDFVCSFIQENKVFLEKQQLSFFEMTVGMAFDYFAKQKVDIAIVEVGLGGRLDSTNIITPELSVITNIGIDHTQFLGSTLSEIAYEKAGIIKHNVPVVVGEYKEETYEVFKAKAASVNSKLYLATSENNFKTDLLGDYQVNNVNTAVMAINTLEGFNVSNKAIEQGLLKVVENTSLNGRWQVLQDSSPKVICDTAHNKEGLIYVLKQIEKESFENLHIVLGFVSDKDLDDVLALFPKKALYYFCKPNIPRGFSVNLLKEKANVFGLEGGVYSSVNEAYSVAKIDSGVGDLVFVGGSTFVVAEII